MGYWSPHPLAGDFPMDVMSQIDSYLFTEEELNNVKTDEQIEAFHKEYKHRLEQNLQALAALEYPEDLQFVLPFQLASYEVRIEDEELSQRNKAMIGDGGAAVRGYDPTGPGKDNKYNSYSSPQDYARELRDLWDELMAGKREFSELGEYKGVIVTMVEHQKAGKKGLINTL